jgi:hypothetical protein
MKYIVTYGKKARRIVTNNKGTEFKKFDTKSNAQKYGRNNLKGKNPRAVKIKWL